MTTGSVGRGTMLAGRYRLEDLLSECDGARFWRGTDRILARSVAVNVLPSSDPRSALVLQAARASATVPEAHLLRVLDCDERGDITWVVNEWGEGTSLDILLQQGPLPAPRAAWLAREVAEAIAAAHRAGVAHGRLVPESVLVTEAGAVKLIGFAISAAIEGRSADEPTLAARGLGPLDAVEADVIDLTGVLYAGLTGRWPGIAPSAVPPAPVDHRGPLRPRQVRAGVPRMLDALCARVLRQEAHEHALPVESADEVLAVLSDEVGDPLRFAPSDVASMYAEPTVSLPWPSTDGTGIPAARLGWMDATADPEATQAAAPDPQLRGAPVHEPVSPAGGRPGPQPEEPVLPPFTEDPERPLFAESHRRRPAPERGSAEWLFGEDEPTPPRRAGRRRADRTAHPIRRALLGLGVLVVLIALVVAVQWGRDRLTGGETGQPSSSPTPSPTTSAPASVLTPAAVHDFDPEGTGAKGRPDPSENPDQVPFATDGDPATGWGTLTYTSAALGGLKGGVGLLFDLGRDRAVGSLEVRFTGTPTTFEVHAAPAGVSEPPQAIDDVRRVGAVQADGPEVVVRLDPPVRTRFLVLWLTQLPPVDGGFRGQVDEVVVRS